MGIGVSILLIAAGAILTFAVDASASSVFNVHTVGLIIMAAGGLGLLTSLVIFTPRRPREVQPPARPQPPATGGPDLPASRSRTVREEIVERD